jgi:hypothetical protein
LNFASEKMSARFILSLITVLSAAAGFSSVAAPANAVEKPTKLYGVVTSSTEQPLEGIGVSIEGPEPEMGEAEKVSLEEDGVLGEFRLSCQIRVDRDLKLKVHMLASEKGWEPGHEVEP